MSKIVSFFSAPTIKPANAYVEESQALNKTWLAARALCAGVFAGAAGYAIGRALSSQRYSLIVPAVAAAVVALASLLQARSTLAKDREAFNQDAMCIRDFVNDVRNAPIKELKDVDFSKFSKTFLNEQWVKLTAYQNYAGLGVTKAPFDELVLKIYAALEPTDQQAAFTAFLHSNLLKSLSIGLSNLSMRNDNFEATYARLVNKQQLWSQPNDGLFDLDDHVALYTLWELACQSEHIPQDNASLFRVVVSKFFAKLNPQQKEDLFLKWINEGNKKRFCSFLDQKLITANDCTPKVQFTCWTSVNILSLERLTLLQQGGFDPNIISNECSPFPIVTDHALESHYINLDFTKLQHLEALLKAGAKYNFNALNRDADPIYDLLNRYPKNFDVTAGPYGVLVRLIKFKEDIMIAELETREITVHNLLIDHFGVFTDRNYDFENVWEHFLSSADRAAKLKNLWQAIIDKCTDAPIARSRLKLIQKAYAAASLDNQTEEFIRMAHGTYVGTLIMRNAAASSSAGNATAEALESFAEGAANLADTVKAGATGWISGAVDWLSPTKK